MLWLYPVKSTEFQTNTAELFIFYLHYGDLLFSFSIFAHGNHIAKVYIYCIYTVVQPPKSFLDYGDKSKISHYVKLIHSSNERLVCMAIFMGGAGGRRLLSISTSSIHNQAETHSENFQDNFRSSCYLFMPYTKHNTHL